MASRQLTSTTDPRQHPRTSHDGNDTRMCWGCGSPHHLIRSCPRRRREQQAQRRGVGSDLPLLPGSRRWCRALRLHNESPRLRRGIITTLRSTPGATIYLDNECIYRGNLSYFYREHASSLGARRSKSPGRGCERGRIRSNSQLRHRGVGGGFVLGNGLDQHADEEVRQPAEGHVLSGDFFVPDKLPNGENATPFSDAGQLVDGSTEPILPLSSITTPDLPVGILQTAKQTLAPRVILAPSCDNSRAALKVAAQRNNKPENANSQLTLLVDDPHFVLGISKDAREAEILNAFQRYIWEIELERTAENMGKEEIFGNNKWDESIRILHTARKQLIGY